MNRFSVQWSRLRGAVALLLLVLGLGAAMVFGAQLYLDSNESEYLRQRAKLDGVARLYRTAENDRSLYSQYVVRYEALKRQGVIGDEPRLSWVEALERINQTLKLPVLRYEVQPQVLVTPTTKRYNSKIIHIYRSSMAIEAGLLHEGDLMTLFARLREYTSGRFEVRNCDLRLINPARGVAFNVRTPNVLALCTVDWYTLKIDDAAAARDRQGS